MHSNQLSNQETATLFYLGKKKKKKTLDPKGFQTFDYQHFIIWSRELKVFNYYNIYYKNSQVRYEHLPLLVWIYIIFWIIIMFLAKDSFHFGVQYL